MAKSCRNDISEISPLAGLANLKWLDIHNNEISDFSPLDGLRENINFHLARNNPAFPKGGPKIEGPWLWVVLPDTELDDSNGFTIRSEWRHGDRGGGCHPWGNRGQVCRG